MGSLVAAVSKNSLDVFEEVYVMLKSLEHRGSDAFGIGSSTALTQNITLKKLQEIQINAPTLIGHNLAKRLPNDTAQPVKDNELTFVFEGRIFPSQPEGAVRYIGEEIRNSSKLEDKALHILREINGAFTFAIVEKNRIVVGRDPLGIYPLYFGESKDCYALATERKALWKIGVKEAKLFPPGCLAIIDNSGYEFSKVRTVTQPLLKKWEMNVAAQQLKELLLKSTEDHTIDLKETAVAFSGGLDSSIIASLVTLLDLKIFPIYVTLEGQKETAFVIRTAETLDIPLRIFEYSIEDVAEILPKIVWLIEEYNPVNVSIALPTFWIAEQASKHKLNFLMTGQGADELFGGYYRYLHELRINGRTGLERMLLQDVVSSFEKNFERDNKVCAYNGVELRNPFVDWRITQFSLSLPTQLKIASPKDFLRKRVLRNMARTIGLPKMITERTKKAIQYTTGVNQALRKIARKEGLTLKKYLEAIFYKSGEN
jgi:asparagine synthase (glutamine-hydrolysing)